MGLPSEWTTGTVSVDGIDLHYYRVGSGPPVVLLHGMYENGQRWLPLGSDLADEYEVIAYDARAHGRSDAPETGYDIDSRVADLVEIVNELALSDPVFVGHSMGAATAAWAAADHPDLPRGLVLEDPSRFHQTPRMSMAEAREAAREHLQEWTALSIEERIEQLSEGDDDADHVRQLAAAIDDCRPQVVKYAQEHRLVKEAFDDISCPTLVLRRDVDVNDRVKDLNVVDRLQNGRLVHVPDAGHDVFLDEYDAAAAELQAFLQRL